MKEKFRVASADRICLVAEISGDGAGHQMQRASRHAEPGSWIVPGLAVCLLAKCSIQAFDNFRNCCEFFDVLFLEKQSFHFVFITNTPSHSSGGGDCFRCSQRSRYIWERKSDGFNSSASRNDFIASSHRRSR